MYFIRTSFLLGIMYSYWRAKSFSPKARERERVIELLHSMHPGVSHMKRLAQSYVCWPGKDTEIENHVTNCHACPENLNSPGKAPLHPWEWPEHALSCVHVDYARPFEGSMFLIVVDAYSKWMEVIPVRHATSQSTIEKLRVILPCMAYQKC